MLAGAILADRVDRVRFVARQVEGLAIHRAAGGNIDEAFDMEATRTLDHIDRSQDIHIRIEQRLNNGTTHIHLSGMMTDKIRALHLENLRQPGIPDIHLIEFCRRI